jgi:hypothetical protein
MSILVGAVALLLSIKTGDALAAAPACPAAPVRWEDDCANLSGQALTGLDRMRYMPFGEKGWLTFGGEARVRSESVDALGFGVDDYPKFVELGGRLLFNADAHFTPKARVFAQLGVADEQGRYEVRSADRDGLDITQLFVDVPFAAPHGTELVARLGRQELDLSDNRLVSPRDGVVIRRAFQGAMLIGENGGTRVSAFHLRPMVIRRGAFDDAFDHKETFDGVSVDLPHALNTQLNAFVFRRQAPDADYVDYKGAERRWTAGIHLLSEIGPWNLDTQATGQWGETPAGQSIRAFGGGSIVTYSFDAPHDPRLIGSLLYASRDKRAADGKLQTFDPLYPSNYGLSSAPFLYQTNYALAGGQGVMRFGATDVGLAAYYVNRASTHDAIYAQGSPIPDTAEVGGKTAIMLQANARTALNRRTDLNLAVVHALAGRALKDAGGRDSTYIRVDIATRF